MNDEDYLEQMSHEEGFETYDDYCDYQEYMDWLYDGEE